MLVCDDAEQIDLAQVWRASPDWGSLGSSSARSICQNQRDRQGDAQDAHQYDGDLEEKVAIHRGLPLGKDTEPLAVI